jgi:hypothetical protein
MSKYSINVYSNFLKIDKKFDSQINLYVDTKIIPTLKDDEINIGLLIEPEESRPIKDFYIKHSHLYDYILTYNDDVLKLCKNAIMFEFGSSWISDFDFNFDKTFSVSFLVGGKGRLAGRKLRHDVWNNQNLISIPKNFFNSSMIPYETEIKSKFLKSEKNPLFTSQFHICIENSSSNGYFSEKLIDCLYTKTIPIYWGSLDIEKRFNIKSIFKAKTLEDIIYICNNLNSGTYESLIDSVEENHLKSLEYKDYTERLIQKINKLITNGKRNIQNN